LPVSDNGVTETFAIVSIAVEGSPYLVQFKSRKIVSLFNWFVDPAVGRSVAEHSQEPCCYYLEYDIKEDPL
jgi:hypothetical protein